MQVKFHRWLQNVSGQCVPFVFGRIYRLGPRDQHRDSFAFGAILHKQGVRTAAGYGIISEQDWSVAQLWHWLTVAGDSLDRTNTRMICWLAKGLDNCRGLPST